MKNNTYEAPLATLVCIDALDVITSSQPTFDGDGVLSDGWTKP